jgi:hypothetical protein
MKKLLITTFLLFSSQSFASAINIQAIEACSLIENDAKRLMCFDNVISGKKIIKKHEKISKSTLNKPLVAESKTQEKLNEFGMENNKEANKEKLDEIQSKLVKVTKNKFGERTFTLSNSQVWKQKGSEFFSAKADDEVIIIRGVFNSFRIKKVGTNRLISVKRIK